QRASDVSGASVVMGHLSIAWAYDISSSSRLLPGMKEMGVDVGLMTRDQAVAVVEAKVAEVAGQKLELAVGDDRASVTLADLGVGAHARGAVDDAFARGRRLSLVRRVWRRRMRKPSEVDV